MHPVFIQGALIYLNQMLNKILTINVKSCIIKVESIPKTVGGQILTPGRE